MPVDNSIMSDIRRDFQLIAILDVLQWTYFAKVYIQKSLFNIFPSLYKPCNWFCIITATFTKVLHTFKQKTWHGNTAFLSWQAACFFSWCRKMVYVVLHTLHCWGCMEIKRLKKRCWPHGDCDCASLKFSFPNVLWNLCSKRSCMYKCMWLYVGSGKPDLCIHVYPWIFLMLYLWDGMHTEKKSPFN